MGWVFMQIEAVVPLGHLVCLNSKQENFSGCAGFIAVDHLDEVVLLVLLLVEKGNAHVHKGKHTPVELF